MPKPPKTGLDALLRPEDSILVLIDHQPYQFTNLNSHEPTTIINNLIGLAKTAKVFNVPTILTTLIEERGGHIIKGLQDVFPDQKPIDRTFINTWEDPKVTDIVKKSGRKQLVLAALYTEICLAMPAIQALAEGYDVFIVTDASGGVSIEADDMAVRRMTAAGAVPITWFARLGEWQRDWTREINRRWQGQRRSGPPRIHECVTGFAKFSRGSREKIATGPSTVAISLASVPFS